MSVSANQPVLRDSANPYGMQVEQNPFNDAPARPMGARAPVQQPYVPAGSANQAPSYGGAPNYANANASSAHLASAGEKQPRYAGVPAATSKRRSIWPWVLTILGIVVVLAIALGVGLGVGLNQDDDKDKNLGDMNVGAAQNKMAPPFPAEVIDAANKASAAGKTDPLTYMATDVYGNPMFGGNLNLAAPGADGKQVGDCGADPWKPTNNINNVRPQHPRLFAPDHLWQCLPAKINNDAYLTVWNYSIFQNATAWSDQQPVSYDVDGGLDLSGILDVSRIVQQRIKSWAYAYRMTRDKKWSKRAFRELRVAAGNVTKQPFGSPATRWNPEHFLDTAEMLTSYAIAFDWMFDAWTDKERAEIIDWMVQYGLAPGLDLYNKNQAWWSEPASGNGNWNCVSNGGLIVGALAIRSEAQGSDADVVNQILPKALDNFKANCMRGVYEDGTWSETPNYWYFGTNAHARALSALETATGSDQGIMDQNKNWYKTGDFHMYVTGNGGMFAYGDNGPNKFATTANQLFLYGQKSDQPRYALFQRDRADAADPLSMFWYDTSSKGAFWNGLALDQWFNNDLGNWVSMRSSWTDMGSVFVAMKASNATGHQTHGDLDAGDFVIDALGTRWAGEYGSDNYLSKDYFTSEANDASRWSYFRKGTQGQNTIVLDQQNQVPNCKPTNKFESTNPKQNEKLDYAPGKDDVAYFTSDMSSCYGAPDGKIKRGIRFLNGRRQVLLQDEIQGGNKQAAWRVQTNATVTLSDDKRTATLEITQVDNTNAGQQSNQTLPAPVRMVVQLLQPPQAAFAVGPAYTDNHPNYYYGADKVPKQDTFPAGVIQKQGDTIPAEIVDNEVNILSIELDGAQDNNVQVLWQPQYPTMDADDKKLPPNVPLDQWSLKSH
ncbi:hypothetical protein MVES1_003341 [Malassezia vespertilionis]|uniref:Heparinase II/III-like C-terminal domain-containing protein n=1 Tax=Malassezia vespertilionis TaxID=2020962 RepID=A0A2N1J745_9BASI|nr:uncharacterized protein MVES1_003341 [Malassezia vespertilionis]PKI82377.1 hypothetical protein MVES_003584 [Malassezia vespertilionis]WFD07972.1 hypothetical protein MVES1_003341 [Malassezia vespertilionis]